MTSTCDILFVSDPDAPKQWKSVRHSLDDHGDTRCGLPVKQFQKDPDDPRTWWHIEKTKDVRIPVCPECFAE